MVIWMAAVVAASLGAVRLDVDASTQLFLGRSGGIDRRLFGLTAFEGFPRVVADADMLARLVAISPGAVRFPCSLAWYGPPSAAKAAGWSASTEAARVLEQSLLFGSRYPLGRFLRTAEVLSAEPMLQITGAPKWLKVDGIGIPEDFRLWAEQAVEVMALACAFSPEISFIELWNEPNASWYRAAKRFASHPGGYVGAHIALFNLAADALKHRLAGLQVGGPVLCWPPAWPPAQKGHKPWYTWEQWTLPFIKGTAGRCDFFDFHAYDVTGEQVATQVELVAAATEQLLGRRLPVWITESNFHVKPSEIGTPAEWQKRALLYIEFLWGLIGQSDKVAGNMAHDLHARAWAILPEPNDPRPLYWVLWMFRDLHGWRAMAVTRDPDVKLAAACADDAVRIVCYNGGYVPKEIELHVKIPAGYWTGPEVRALVPRPDGSFEPGTIPVMHTRRAGEAVLAFTLQAKQIVALILRADRFLFPRQKVQATEYFGQPLMVPIANGQQATVNVDVGEVKGAGTFLRLGLLAPEGASVTVQVAGNTVVLSDPAPWQEMPVSGIVKGRNVFRVAARGGQPNLTLAFLSVVVVR